MTTEFAFLVRRSLLACPNTRRELVGGAPRLPGTPKCRRLGWNQRPFGECWLVRVWISPSLNVISCHFSQRWQVWRADRCGTGTKQTAARERRLCKSSREQSRTSGMTLQTLSFIFGGLLLLVGILGGGFEVKEIKIPTVPFGGRVVAAIVGLVFIGLAFKVQGPADNHVPPLVPKMSPMEFDIDRWGSDYNHIDIARDDPTLCQDECKQDPKCKAWTYVKRAIQGPQPRCWLKDRLPPPQSNPCCVSGEKVE
jgi:hypothetical protein